MPRINVVPVKELCDQHLKSEFKSINRLVLRIFNGAIPLQSDRPEYYVTGKGNDRFFTDKLAYVYDRYTRCLTELERRGIPCTDVWPEAFLQRTTTRYWNHYRASSHAINDNRRVLRESLPQRAKWSEYLS